MADGGQPELRQKLEVKPGDHIVLVSTDNEKMDIDGVDDPAFPRFVNDVLRMCSEATDPRQNNPAVVRKALVDLRDAIIRTAVSLPDRVVNEIDVFLLQR